MQSDGSPQFLRVPQERPMSDSTSSLRTSRSPCEELSGPRRGPSEIGSPTSTRNPMADWQIRTKRPLRGPVREEAGPTLKNYITPTGLQRLKDEHLFRIRISFSRTVARVRSRFATLLQAIKSNI